MKKNDIYWLSIIGSIVSLAAIFIFISYFVPESVKIKDIDNTHIGTIVNVTGKITKITNREGSIFLTIEDETGNINVIIWDSVIKSLEMKGLDPHSLKENLSINLQSEVISYEGHLELSPTKPFITIVSQEYSQNFT